MSSLKVNGLAVLDMQPASFVLHPAECVCLSGPSGVGKSLLLRALADLIPHSGEVWLDDVLCQNMPPSVWRRKVGLCMAESHWWSDRVGDHFIKPDLDIFAELGFDKGVLDWQVSRCSTGEKQRLSLLRLLGNQPQVLLLDEPTASLDSASVGRVETLIRHYCEQHAAPVLWVSHDNRQIERIAQRRFVMENKMLKEVEA